METTINKELYKVLKGFDNRYFLDEELNKNKVIQDLEDYNPKLLQALLSNDLLKKYFTMNIEGHTILQTSKLIELFELNDYWKSSYTRYSKKIGLTTNGKFIDESNDVVLDFPYKDTVLKASMSKEDTDQDGLRPDEPFLNEVIAKEEIDQLLEEKIFSNVKRYSNSGNHVVDRFDKKDNLIIKGNNLLALNSLKKSCANKIKSIIIDPPYYFSKIKPADSFLYNSNFKMSTWLTFMKNRLEISRELLVDDGFLIIIIGIDGYAHLKLLADEVFQGEGHHIGTITWRKTDNQSNVGHFANVVDYILIYRKDIESNLNKLPLTDKAKKEYSYEDGKGKYRRANLLDRTRGRYEYKVFTPDGNVLNGPWMIEEEVYKSLKEIDKIHWPKKGKQIPYGKIYLSEAIENGQITSDFWDGSFGTNQRSAEEIKQLFGYRAFEYAKPEKLMMNLISLTTQKGDVVLDFFLGSGTTAAVAHKMGRQYIGIEQIDYINTVTVPRLQKVIEGEQGGISKDVDWQGGGNFVYAELMEKNRGFIKMIQEAEDPLALQKIFDFMLEEAEIDFRVDLEEVKDTLHELSFEDQKKILFAIIDKNQLYYSYSEIDEENVRDLLADEDYAFNKSFYEEGEE